jgi:hypothetical protein
MDHQAQDVQSSYIPKYYRTDILRERLILNIADFYVDGFSAIIHLYIIIVVIIIVII